MSTLTALLVGVVAILGLARLNHSNKLFWTFLVSMLLGFAGAGSIRYSLDHIGKKNTDATYIMPMQGSTTLTIVDPALLPDTPAITTSKQKIVRAELASQYDVYRDIATVDRTRTSFNPETDIGFIEPINTS